MAGESERQRYQLAVPSEREGEKGEGQSFVLRKGILSTFRLTEGLMSEVQDR